MIKVRFPGLCFNVNNVLSLVGRKHFLTELEVGGFDKDLEISHVLDELDHVHLFLDSLASSFVESGQGILSETATAYTPKRFLHKNI